MQKPHFFFIKAQTPKDVVVQLPVPPLDEFPFSAKMNNETLSIIGIGEVNILKGQALKTMSISSFLPLNPDMGWYHTTGLFETPDFYIKMFDEAQKTNTPLRLVVTELGVDVLVSVESFDYAYMTTDVKYSLELKEYKRFGIREVKLITKETTNTTGTQPVAETTTTAQTTTSDREKTKFSIGDTVECMGSYYHTSYGDKPSSTFKKGFVGKISHMVASPKYGQSWTIHITTLSGSSALTDRPQWIGWVKPEQLTHKK